MDFYTIIASATAVVTSLGFNLLKAIVVLVIGLYLIKAFGKWLKTTSKLDKIDRGVRAFMTSFANILLYALLVIVIATVLGVPTTSFITILASCGVAIGLALQGSLSNFAGGLMILFFKPFKIGDFIEASGESGTVVDISVVYTILLTPDNKRITVPNGTLTNSVIKNYSAEELRRVDFTFTASYGNDIEKVKKIITDVVSSHALTLDDPAPFVRLSAHSDNCLTYTARAWCKNSDYWTVNFDVIETVKNEFDKNGIEIPYPQLDVHVKNN
jgi:small conductance mechanosensitive channel